MLDAGLTKTLMAEVDGGFERQIAFTAAWCGLERQ